MVYDSEIVRKNMKFLRKSYNMNQREFAKIISVSQHGLSQYETGKRGVNYEFVQTIANYFRIPIEIFVKEDLSEILEFHSDIDLKYLSELFETMFPIFQPSTKTSDKYFQKGYDILSDIIEASKEYKYIEMKKLNDCIASFVLSYNKFCTIESIANCVGFMILIYAPVFDKRKQAIGEQIIEQQKFNKKLLLQNKADDDSAWKEFVEENDDFILEGIRILKGYEQWAPLGDYYFALRYLVNVVDNEYEEDMNNLIGEELMSALVRLENDYAMVYWDKKYNG
ncbi:helix-turn-helix domain-containing protein [Faecalicatena contorta]|uniref:helix-turn-helix domain-containing protein n=1 Tax=Faecalicatena contorta TaxID=39482 RepID=UPI001F3F6F6A|nr:helix-turn-helix transcriptional regulator [Faecalicatena contorta]MCF2554396.1 helix-turn-helix transcriptional regulator [Faecalicatena contorta]